MRVYAKSRDDGVTAIQTMIVIVIIGILAYLAVPVWGQLVERSKMKSCQANQRTIAQTIAMARTDGYAGGFVGYFDAALEEGHDWGRVLIPRYMAKAPRCPVSGAYYNLSPFGVIRSDMGSGQYSWVNQGLETDHRLVAQ